MEPRINSTKFKPCGDKQCIASPGKNVHIKNDYRAAPMGDVAGNANEGFQFGGEQEMDGEANHNCFKERRRRFDASHLSGNGEVPFHRLKRSASSFFGPAICCTSKWTPA